MIKVKLYFILIFTSLLSCERSFDSIHYIYEDSVPIGTWVFKEYSNGISIYEISEQFEDDKEGLMFNVDKSFIERTFGWCATPPLTFSNHKGTWQLLNRNTFKLDFQYYEKKLIVHSFDEYELRISFKIE